MKMKQQITDRKTKRFKKKENIKYPYKKGGGRRCLMKNQENK